MFIFLLFIYFREMWEAVERNRRQENEQNSKLAQHSKTVILPDRLYDAVDKRVKYYAKWVSLITIHNIRAVFFILLLYMVWYCLSHFLSVTIKFIVLQLIWWLVWVLTPFHEFYLQHFSVPPYSLTYINIVSVQV